MRRLFALLLAAGTPAAATDLPTVMAAALAQAPILAEAQAGEAQAAARLRAARGEAGPMVAISGTIGVGRLDPGGYFGLANSAVTPRAAQVSIEQPIYAGGRVAAGIAAARAGTAAATAGSAAARGQLRLAVARSYGEALAADQAIAMATRLVAATASIADSARRRFEAGEGARTEIALAQARQAEAEAALARAQGQAELARARLANLSGLGMANLASLAPLPDDPPLPATLDEAEALAADRSPALLQAQQALAAAQAGARGARGARLPAVGAFAEAGAVRDQFFPDYRADSATVGLRARWTLFDAGRSGGQIDAASAEVRLAEARLASARAALTEQLVGAFAARRSAEAASAAARRQQQAAEQALADTRAEVAAGMKSQQALLDAERDAAAAGMALAAAAAERTATAWQLLAITGAE